MKEFAERLKSLRQEKGLTLVELSRELKNEVSKSAIGQWEQGISTPNLEVAKILAQYFNVSIDYLAGLED